MLDLSQPTRQSKKSILFYLFKNIKGVLVIGLYAIFGWNSSREMLWSVGIIVLFTVIALIAPVFRYYFFKFHIAAGELIITDGLLFKTRKAVPLERIQSININQNLLQRVLGISSLELETAGSSAKELEIPALNSAFAKAFKDTLKIKTQAAIAQPAILQDSDAIVTESTEESKPSTEPQLQETVEEQESRTIIKLGLVDLLKIGLTQNHLASGGVALGVVIGLWFQIKDIVERFIGDPFENLDEDLKETVVSGSFHIADYLGTAVVAFMLFCVISVVVSLALVINRYWDFELVHDGDTLEVEMGLFNKREVKMPIGKVQILEFHSNPLRKLLGYQTAKIYQAQAQDTKIGAIEVPACTLSLMKELQQLIFNELLESSIIALKPNPWSYMRLSLYIMSIFMLPLLAVSVYFEQFIGVIISITILLVAAFVNYKIGLHNALERDDDFVIFKKGWLFPSIIIMPIYKVQAVGFWRSIFLKRRKEIHATVHTAAGSRSIKYLKENEARSLVNSVHNEVLLTERSWM